MLIKNRTKFVSIMISFIILISASAIYLLNVGKSTTVAFAASPGTQYTITFNRGNLEEFFKENLNSMMI